MAFIAPAVSSFAAILLIVVLGDDETMKLRCEKWDEPACVRGRPRSARGLAAAENAPAFCVTAARESPEFDFPATPVLRHIGWRQRPIPARGKLAIAPVQ